MIRYIIVTAENHVVLLFITFYNYTILVPFLLRLDEEKVERVLHETEKNRHMVSQILSATCKFQGGGQETLKLGPKVI